MMRAGRALVLGLLAGLLAGCATGTSTHSGSWLERFRPTQFLPTGPDVVQMEVVLLERPVGDPYINQEVWQLADEQIVPLERKAVLEKNGFRVGQIGGLTPGGLQNLLASNRSCADPRRHYIRAGNPRLLGLGPQTRQCRFRLDLEEQATESAFEQALCGVSVLPTLADKGALNLQFTPEIDYGVAQFQAEPSAEESGFQFQHKRPTKTFPALSWELNVSPNQYIIIGAKADRYDSLGTQCFIRRDEPSPVQRLLVLRAWRGAASGEESPWAEDNLSSTPRPAPLALQAGWTTARGQAD
jgi:hypothetical protein